MPATPIFDPNPGLHPGAVGSAVRCKPIVPADATDLPLMARMIWVGVGGSIAVQLRDDARGSPPVVFTAVPSGTMLRLWTRQVWATGTTATNLVAVA